MKNFFRFVILYLILAVLVTGLTRPLHVDLLLEAIAATIAFSTSIVSATMWLLPVFVAVPLIMGWRQFLANAHMIGYAVVGSVLLQVGFSFLKSAIPVVVPFYADAKLADFDKWLHGGVDPWAIAHEWGQILPIDQLLPVYLSVWVIPAIALALIISVSDRCAERTARFMVLYISCWFVLGNVVALAGSSAGPVYYDALLGGDRFAGLAAALETSGLKESKIGLIQGYLWRAYAERGMAIGSGISAFPSVHVGIATITAIYLTERNRWLAIPGIAFLGTILFLSVYTGYHYAVDGYFSILFIGGLWAVLRRVELSTLSTSTLRLRPRDDGSTEGAA